ncbi:unnamed protein product [Orchesella dallaii]|uniref:C2H2-type domain-containing protein n=1 Tax=Orchesella dallaii TaxID=48710 RepID=A0ABP1RXV3_9HEXA
MELNFCLFCATPCPPTSQISVGEHVNSFKIEQDILPEDNCQFSSAPTSTLSSLPLFLKEEGSSTLAEQLEVIFILKNILEVKDDMLCHFLSRLGKGQGPQTWVKVCVACSEVVCKFWMISKQISNLKKQQINIQKELKERIHTTRESFASSSQSFIWKEIPEEVLKVTFIPTPPSPTTFPINSIEEDENHSEESDTKITITSNIFSEDENVNDNDESTRITDPLIPVSSDYVITPDIHNEEEEIEAEFIQFDVKYHHNHSPPDFTQEVNGIDDNVDAVIVDNNGSHPSPQNSQQNMPVKAKRFPFPDLPPSQHPRYIRTSKKYYSAYKCLECSFYATNYSISQFKPHMELHRPGSVGVKCGICGWLLHPDKVAHHNAHHHPIRKRGDGKKQQRTYYKCGDCGALNSERRAFKIHKELHNSSRGHICSQPGCGWLCSNLASHQGNWHPPEGSSKERRVKLLMATSQIILG